MNELAVIPEHNSTAPVLSSDDILSRIADAVDHRAVIQNAYRARHADSTRQNYDMWWDRFVAWCEDATTRSVDVDGLGEFSIMSIIPVTAEQLETEFPWQAFEQVVIVYVTTEFTGFAPEGVDLQEWLAENPPIKPATLNACLAALKSRASDYQPRLKWEPSSVFTGTMTGVRRTLADNHSGTRQATPLITGHIEALAQHLTSSGLSPTLASDRLIVELIAAGVTRAEIGRCLLSGYTPAGTYPTEQGPAYFGDRLIIPGRRRRGGNIDPDRVINLEDHPLLRAALTAWFRVRPDAGDHLLGTTTKNLTRHINDSLCRTIDVAGIDWTPSDTAPSTSDITAMRAALDAGTHFDTSMVTRRDHVALLVGYFGALRRSELCGLTIGDITWTNDKGRRRADVLIAKSKTDQMGEGQHVYLHNPDTERAPSYMHVCDVLHQWITTLDQLGLGPNDPLFPTFHRDGTPRPKHLDPNDWAARLKTLAADARVFGEPTAMNQNEYDAVTGHSLRRGFVTAAILENIDVVVIAKQTRHKNIQMLAVYADKVLAARTDWGAALYGVTDGMAARVAATGTADKQRDTALAETEHLKDEIERLRAEIAELRPTG